jgi:predicted nucleic acid-binding protein
VHDNGLTPPGNVVFLDANVLFSAAYRRTAGLRRLWQMPAIRLVTSAYAVAEAERNLSTREQREDLAALLRDVEVFPAIIAGLPLAMRVHQLPEKDRPILLAAIAAKATHLLTGDVRHFGAYFGQRIGGVLILPPAEFLRQRSQTLDDT